MKSSNSLPLLLMSILVLAVMLAGVLMLSEGAEESTTEQVDLEVEAEESREARRHTKSMTEPAPITPPLELPAERGDVPEVERPIEVGHVVVRVLDDFERPMPTGTVVITSAESEAVSKPLNDEGLAEFELPPGDHVAALSHLPDGLLAPWEYAEFNAHPLSVAATSRQVVTLRVVKACSVEGRVVDASRAPIEGADVRLQATKLSSMDQDAQTDRDGRFVFSRAHPGAYRVQVWTVNATEPALRELPRPDPLDFEVTSGSLAQLPDIVVGAGGTESLEGRVVDLEGQPIQGVPILCYPKANDPGEAAHNWTSSYGTSVTDASGRFRFENLPSRDVRVQPTWEPGKVPGAQPTSWWARPKDVRLEDGSTTVPDFVMRRSRPFVFSGIVALEGLKRGHRDVEVRIAFEEPGAVLPAHEAQRPPAAPAKIRLRRDGSFEWHCETPHEAVVITVCAKKDDRSMTYRIEPRPNGTETHRFELPRP